MRRTACHPHFGGNYPVRLNHYDTVGHGPIRHGSLVRDCVCLEKQNTKILYNVASPARFITELGLHFMCVR